MIACRHKKRGSFDPRFFVVKMLFFDFCLIYYKFVFFDYTSLFGFIEQDVFVNEGIISFFNMEIIDRIDGGDFGDNSMYSYVEFWEII